MNLAFFILLGFWGFGVLGFCVKTSSFEWCGLWFAAIRYGARTCTPPHTSTAVALKAITGRGTATSFCILCQQCERFIRIPPLRFRESLLVPVQKAIKTCLVVVWMEDVFQRHASFGREMWKMTTYKVTYLYELAINLVRWQLRWHHEKGWGVDNDFFQFNQNCYGYINVAFLYGGLMGSLKGPNLGNKLDWNPGGIIPSWAGELYKNKDLHNSTRLRPLPKSRFFCLRR